MDLPMLWGIVVSVSVASVVWPLARVGLQLNDEDDWPFGPTWFALSLGWVAFLVVIYLSLP